MSSTDKTRWLRLLAEAAAIILSILAAFAIDAWWDDVKQQKHLQSVLGILEAEFVENIDLIDYNIDYVNGDQEYLKRFIIMSPEDASKIPPEQTFATIEAIWRPGTEVSNNNFIIGMLESENLPLLEYPQLQQAISQWRAEISELDERAIQLAGNELEALRALGRHSDVRTVLAMSIQESRVLSGQAMREIREDQEVMAIAGRKVFMAQIHLIVLRRFRGESESVLIFIHQALAAG